MNSMSDLFHEGVADEYIREVVECDASGELAYLSGIDQTIGPNAGIARNKLNDAAAAPQIWWGVSVENRRDGLPRLDDLQYNAGQHPIPFH